MARETLENIPVARPEPTPKARQNLCLDKGYDYDEIRALADEFNFTAHISSRGEESQQVKRALEKRRADE